MKAQTAKACIAVFLGCVTLWHTGCSLPTGFSKEFSQVAMNTAAMMKDQGVMDQFTSNIRGHVNDAGIESYVTVTTAAGTRLVGMDGDIMLNTSGTGTQLPHGAREALIAQLGQPISDAQRDSILTLLGWNRVSSPHNTPPSGVTDPGGAASGVTDPGAGGS